MMSETRSLASRVSARAFTLIEVLVVLIIIAIITGVAVAAFGQFGQDRRERIIAHQFANIITIAQQQSILTPEILGLGITPNGYSFFEYVVPFGAQTGKWQLIPRNAITHPDAFKKVFSVNIKAMMGYEPDEKNQKEPQPQILFLPSGFVTPFTLELQSKKNQFSITVKNNGVVTFQENGKNA